ncbi:MAG TPA: type I-B CRISPR-associated protein Cas7/Cst2/DevR [Hungateiclostridium thermocellum]|jgi:CRISPR-associated protein Cst2|uniref:CRISPR-associated regulatory protein, DevR family n=2 Tax=Acetivibrio thermocellus TaxID=1515 RepID=A3DHS4_ACET2|nr:type I-B CRISPR-associated protein Cas7/Cst2/DevR [Acetivibrio thermocellus]CDG36821.1 CRISPR-associated autoregulator DevR family protein [Acetivibrio thermocellus BC1]ABN53503.1 CRISPR-associated regulatory protein, DevR family [Acetivibrio thermocellus ATCC 27405]ADU75952.1 CRISPR-associated autoregulator, DevR family [Acetivibrio thermocellus DSM 1313]ALX09987.1 CRISPR-associated autoregulator, DevR family [Acetivibrio thermocellus AD2]ANV77761.1 CRISPR-associated autoregulator, DevR fa
MKDAKAITVTYLTKASYSSLNGADKEADNIVSIKKIQMNDGKEYPYCSSQAVRRALREQLASMGWELSETTVAKQKKGAASTLCEPSKYIDDDLFGFMNADSSKTVKRTSPVRVSPLVALEPYGGGMDFGTNYMSVKAGGTPNIFETEIHSGYYVGTVLIELDRVGEKSPGDEYDLSLSQDEKKKRVNALVDAIQNLWTVGRQSRFLSDVSPKFVAAAVLKVKNPIFLECIKIGSSGSVDMSLVKNTVDDFHKQIIDYAIGERKGFFAQDSETALPLGQCFEKIHSWVEEYYKD